MQFYNIQEINGIMDYVNSTDQQPFFSQLDRWAKNVWLYEERLHTQAQLETPETAKPVEMKTKPMRRARRKPIRPIAIFIEIEDSEEEQPSCNPDHPPAVSPAESSQLDLKKEEPSQLDEEVRSTPDQPASFGKTVSHHNSENVES